jgi:Zn-dependent alcohol dehydrogenase
MADKLNFAVVGCGGFGTRRINAIKKIGAKLVCLVDTDKEKVTKLAREAGCEYHVNYKDAVKRNDIDCIVVATPNKFQLQIVKFETLSLCKILQLIIFMVVKNSHAVSAFSALSAVKRITPGVLPPKPATAI